MRRPTFSKLGLAVTCPASMVLPAVTVIKDDDEDDMPRLRGTVIHRFAQQVSDFQRDDPTLTLGERVELAVADAPDEWQATLRSIDVDALPLHLAAEVAFAWDWKKRKGRVLGQGIDRDYGTLASTEVAGTADIVGVAKPIVLVADTKTGRRRVAPAARNLQLLASALAACDVYGCDEAVVEILYIDEDGLVWPDRAGVDSWDLAAAAEQIERAMTEAGRLDVEWRAGRSLPLVAGAHCADCSSLKICPATTALVRAFPDEIEQLTREKPLTHERLAHVWHQTQAARFVLGELENEIRRLACVEPIDLGDGTVLGLVETKRESLDGQIALAQLANVVGEERARSAAKVQLSKKAARDAIALANPGKKLTTKQRTGLYDRYLDTLRAKGAIHVKPGRKVKPYKRKV